VLLAAVLGMVWLLATVLHATGLGSPGLRGGALILAAGMGVALVYAMARVYRLRTAPVWDSVLTTASFFLTAAVLGSLATALVLSLDVPGLEPAIRELTWVSMAGLMAELVLIPVMRRHIQETRRSTDPGLRGDPPGRWSTLGRGALLGAGLLASIGALFMATVGAGSIGMALVPPTLTVAVAAALAGEVVGRSAFYRAYARVGM
jgi:DMSO reductase anchor subunit